MRAVINHGKTFQAAFIGHLTLSAAVEVHSALMRIWGKAGAEGKRSLASKYLHFHRPGVFPLFDSQAAMGIRRVTPRGKRISKLAAKHADAKYKAFCERYLWLLETIQKRFGTRLSPRHADTLLAVADRPRP
jgi:hypothetical protein